MTTTSGEGAVGTSTPASASSSAPVMAFNFPYPLLVVGFLVYLGGLYSSWSIDNRR